MSDEDILKAREDARQMRELAAHMRKAGKDQLAKQAEEDAEKYDKEVLNLHLKKMSPNTGGGGHDG